MPAQDCTVCGGRKRKMAPDLHICPNCPAEAPKAAPKKKAAAKKK